MEYINWIIEHWVEILAALTSLVTVASTVTKFTTTPRDDEWCAKIYGWIEKIALVTGKAKQK